MSQEREAPDVILELTNLTGVVSEIQDDPDSPDANWLDAASNNVDSICRVSFPTPSGNPTVGAGLQEFRALVRKFGGTGTPTAYIALYENGVLVRAGSVVNVTGPLVISFPWNANEISNADGSLVECRIYGTKTGGAPAVRATVEVGAIEWNCEWSAVEREAYIDGFLVPVTGEISCGVIVTGSLAGIAAPAVGAVVGGVEINADLDGLLVAIIGNVQMSLDTGINHDLLIDGLAFRETGSPGAHHLIINSQHFERVP